MVDACRLCGEAKVLRNSHIISEFLFAPLYDEKHRARLADRAFSSIRFIQQGLREYLLEKVPERCRKVPPIRRRLSITRGFPELEGNPSRHFGKRL
jgi:hypothetical protein